MLANFHKKACWILKRTSRGMQISLVKVLKSRNYTQGVN